ncbi:disintegrin and metalloproteinase domain-containing protein 33 [Rhinophrynus dorsalis]
MAAENLVQHEIQDGRRARNLQTWSADRNLPSNAAAISTPPGRVLLTLGWYHRSTNSESKIQYSIRIGQQEYRLNLSKAHDLLALNFTASHYEEDGTLVTELLGHQAHCCYTGVVDGFIDSLVSLCICQGLSGYITLREQIYSIDAVSQSESTEHMVVKISIHRKTHPTAAANVRSLRSIQETTIGQGRGAPYNIELFLVADKQEFQRHGKDLEKTRHHLMAVAHHLNQIFSKINFQIFLVGIEVWTQENKADISEAASSSLLGFLEWRQQVLLPRMHHDNIQLISGEHFKNHTLGEAFMAKMCSPSQSGGVIKDTGVSPKDLAKYVAHEMGHNLGMKHDTDHCYCPAKPGRCLLSRRTGYSMSGVFSDCSHRFLDRFLEEEDIACLKDRPQIYIEELALLSHPDIDLETGKVFLLLCILIILPTYVMIWRFCRRPQLEPVVKKKKMEMDFSPDQLCCEHHNVMV